MDGNTLYVEAKTTSAEEVIIRNMEVLIKIIEKYKGSTFKIKHSSKSEPTINQNKITTEEIAANAASRLGIEVEISD
jgi:hypothetical protein